MVMKVCHRLACLWPDSYSPAECDGDVIIMSDPSCRGSDRGLFKESSGWEENQERQARGVPSLGRAQRRQTGRDPEGAG